MNAIIRSLSKKKLEIVVLQMLFICVLVALILLINAIDTGYTLLMLIDNYLLTIATEADFLASIEVVDVRSGIQSSISFVSILALLVIIMCVLILPFIQWLFSLTKGYEIGVLRALGLSRLKAWWKLFLENTLLTGLSCLISACIALLVYKPTTMMLLAFDEDAQSVIASVVYSDSVLNIRVYALIGTLILAIGSLLVMSVFNAVIIAKNAPLKILREHK